MFALNFTAFVKSIFEAVDAPLGIPGVEERHKRNSTPARKVEDVRRRIKFLGYGREQYSEGKLCRSADSPGSYKSLEDAGEENDGPTVKHKAGTRVPFVHTSPAWSVHHIMTIRPQKVAMIKIREGSAARDAMKTINCRGEDCVFMRVS
jgi:hypothetical protein